MNLDELAVFSSIGYKWSVQDGQVIFDSCPHH